MSRMEDFTGTPFVAGSIYGTRSFAIDKLGRLTGPQFKDTFWTPGENIALDGGYNGTSFAHRNWGFYAFKDGSDEYKSPSTVSGVIEGYGMVQIGTKGFRAQKAKIVALHINKRSKIRSYQKATRLLQRFTDMLDEVTLVFWFLLAVWSIVSAVRFFIGLNQDASDITQHSMISFIFSVAFLGWWVYTMIIPAIPSNNDMKDYMSGILRLEENYPDVRFFASYKAMVKEYPTVTTSYEDLRPDDPNFWKVKIP